MWQYLKPRDVVVFRAGTYVDPNMGGGAPVDESGTAGNPITIMSMPGEVVAFQTNSSYTFDTAGANYLIIDGFTIDNPTNVGLGTGYGCAGTTGTVIRNIEAQRFNYISCIDNMHDLVLEKLVHHHQSEHGLYMGARNNPGTNITVRKSIFYKNGHLSGYGNFQYNGRVTGMVIEDYIFHSSGQWGLSLIMGVSNSVIRNNLIFNNEGHGIVMQVYPGDCIGGTDGICPYSQTGNLFTNNTIWVGRYDMEGVESSIPFSCSGCLGGAECWCRGGRPVRSREQHVSEQHSGHV